MYMSTLTALSSLTLCNFHDIDVLWCLQPLKDQRLYFDFNVNECKRLIFLWRMMLKMA